MVFFQKKNSFKTGGTVQIWFLDEDPAISAGYQTNYTLNKSIDGCFKALVTARMYFSGIRSRKFYEYFLTGERRYDTMDDFFPDWPFKKHPVFTTYTSPTSKWCRQCAEHAGYVEDTLDALLAEYEYRFGKTHSLHDFLQWHRLHCFHTRIPFAGLKKIVLPWKALGKKWRRKNVVDGYRLQFMNSFISDPFSEYDGSRRDIPEFVIRYFQLDVAGID